MDNSRRFQGALLEIFLGVAFWLVIFMVWYVRNYPEKLPSFLRRKPRKNGGSGQSAKTAPKLDKSSKEYRRLVEIVENVCARDRFGSADAASMVLAVRKLVDIEKASGQIWETYALDALETAQIWCDDCKQPVRKNITKVGVRIECPVCDQWLELNNSKVTVLDFPKKTVGKS